MKNFFNKMALSLCALAISLLLTGCVAFAWTEPTSTAPAGNVAAPINSGSATQTKTGNLNISGSVGIGGITSPAQKLDVAGYIKTNAGFCINSDCLTSWGSITGPWTISGNNIYNKNTGNVGIGTTNPSTKLDISGIIRASGDIYTTNAGLGSTSNSEVGGNLSLTNPQKTANGTANHWTIYNMTGGYGNKLGFWAYDTIGCVSGGMCNERFSIYDNGNVYVPRNLGIGTASPGYKLQVNGDIYANGGWLRTSGDAGWYSESYGGGWYMSDTSWIRSYNGKNLWLSNGLLGSNGGLTVGYGGAGSPAAGAIIAGNVGIGTASPNAKLNVIGTTNLSRNNTAECCSSGDFTLSLAENTAGTGKKAGIQFHNSGVSEGQLRLDNGTKGRELKIYSYQTDMDLHATGYVQGDQGLCIGSDCRTSWASISGATTFANLAGIPTRTAWSGVHRGFVAEQLSWKNYGNGHTIFDASQGTSPNGGAVSNTNSQVAWTASYPTLMGWNGANTYGVRVDSARVSDGADAVDGYHLNQNVTSGANPQWGTTYANNWFRSQGASGWYNESYGGGIWMDQSNYVRVYGGKGFTVDGNVGIGTAAPWAKLTVSGGKAAFTRDGVGECCGNDATITLGESTSGTGRKASISFHNGGVAEGTLELANGGERRFVMRDNQGALMGLEITGRIKIGGGSPGAGKVLTSDANGYATWSAPPSTGITGGNCPAGQAIVSISSSGVIECKSFDGSNPYGFIPQGGCNQVLPAGNKKIFVTSATFSGSEISSQEAANNKCNDAALNNLSGHYHALISWQGSSPYTPITNNAYWNGKRIGTSADCYWYKIAVSPGDFFNVGTGTASGTNKGADNYLWNSISYDERGQLSYNQVWTNFRPTGSGGYSSNINNSGMCYCYTTYDESGYWTTHGVHVYGNSSDKAISWANLEYHASSQTSDACSPCKNTKRAFYCVEQ